MGGIHCVDFSFIYIFCLHILSKIPSLSSIPPSIALPVSLSLFQIIINFDLIHTYIYIYIVTHICWTGKLGFITYWGFCVNWNCETCVRLIGIVHGMDILLKFWSRGWRSHHGFANYGCARWQERGGDCERVGMGRLWTVKPEEMRKEKYG